MPAQIIYVGGSWRYVKNDALVPNVDPPPPPPPALRYLALTGASGSAAQVAAGAASEALNLPGTQTVYALVRGADMTPAGPQPRILASKWADTGAQRSYVWAITDILANRGGAYFQPSPTGTSWAEILTAAPDPPLSDATWLWLRLRFEASTRLVTLSTAPVGTNPDPTADPLAMVWTVRGSSPAGAPLSATYASTAPFTIGGIAEMTYGQWVGDVAQMVVTDAAGAVVFKLDPSNWTTGTSWTTSTGHTVNLIGAGATIATIGTVTPPPPDVTPDSLPNLVGWWDPAEAFSTPQAAVTSWPAAAGTVPMVVTGTPTKVADGRPSGGAAIDIAATGSYLTATGTNLIAGTTLTVVAAVRLRASGIHARVLSAASAAGPADWSVATGFAINHEQSQWWPGGVRASTVMSGNQGSSLIGQWLIVCDVFDGVNNTKRWARLGDTAWTVGTPVPSTGTFDIDVIRLGANAVTAGDPASVQIGDVAIYSDAKSGTALTTLLEMFYKRTFGSAVVPPPDEPPPPTGTPTTGALPIVMPARATMRAAPRVVFAHYFTQFPVSMDNRPDLQTYYATQYNRPGGDGPGGNSAQYGGWFRNRPIAEPPSRPRSGTGPQGYGSELRGDTDWAFADARAEVQTAIDAGFDGFTMNGLSLNGYHWERQQQMYKAANVVNNATGANFKILYMPDAFAGGTESQTLLADRIQTLNSAYPNVMYRLPAPDGRLVISPFLAEGETPQWWQQWLSIMNSRGLPVAFWPTFNNYGGNIGNFTSFSYGASIWGGRSVNTGNHTSQGNDAHNRGLKWMHPVATQDLRAHNQIYDEAWNTETLRMMWDNANACNAEMVQVITWNDYSEQAEIAPSRSLGGHAAIDMDAYYIVRYKLGAPPITRDTIYVTHRLHPVAARATGGQTLYMNLRGGSSTPRDTIEAVTFCRSVSQVRITVGSSVTDYTAPAGVSARTVPFGLGTITVRLTAQDGRVTTVTSPFPTTNSPVVQDLQYHYVSSGRSGTQTA